MLPDKFIYYVEVALQIQPAVFIMQFPACFAAVEQIKSFFEGYVQFFRQFGYDASDPLP